MAKFIYRMQNVLNIKERLETQAKTEYAEKMIKFQEEEDKMRTLVVRNREYEQEAKRLATGRLDASAMKRCSDAIRAMKDLLQQQAIHMKMAQKNLEVARMKLNTAVQERKVQEKLRERAFEEFKLEIAADEKKEIDELVSFTYNDNNKETGE